MADLSALVPGRWKVDPSHSRIGFSARHLVVAKVHGSFEKFEADLVIAPDPMQSTVEVTIQVASLTTGDDGRDNHLRSADFFDVEHYPTMTFTATSFERSRDAFRMHGNLTVRAVTRPVTFDLQFEGVSGDPWGGTRAGFTATTEVNRKDWGLEWNMALETGGVLVGEKVKVELDIEAVKE